MNNCIWPTQSGRLRRRPLRFSSGFFAAVLIGWVWLGSLAGCSRSPYEIAPVSGTVTRDGSPLADVVVSFQPIAAGRSGEAGPGSYGVTDAQGRFALELIGENRKGAVVGRHRVTFAAKTPQRESSDDTAAPPGSGVVPREYELEPPEFEVPARGTTEANFALDSK